MIYGAFIHTLYIRNSLNFLFKPSLLSQLTHTSTNSMRYLPPPNHQHIPSVPNICLDSPKIWLIYKYWTVTYKLQIRDLLLVSTKHPVLYSIFHWITYIQNSHNKKSIKATLIQVIQDSTFKPFIEKQQNTKLQKHINSNGRKNRNPSLKNHK